MIELRIRAHAFLSQVTARSNDIKPARNFRSSTMLHRSWLVAAIIRKSTARCGCRPAARTTFPEERGEVLAAAQDECHHCVFLWRSGRVTLKVVPSPFVVADR